jgi:hypothetical protein
MPFVSATGTWHSILRFRAQTKFLPNIPWYRRLAQHNARSVDCAEATTARLGAVWALHCGRTWKESSQGHGMRSVARRSHPSRDPRARNTCASSLCTIPVCKLPEMLPRAVGCAPVVAAAAVRISCGRVQRSSKPCNWVANAPKQSLMPVSVLVTFERMEAVGVGTARAVSKRRA